MQPTGSGTGSNRASRANSLSGTWLCSQGKLLVSAFSVRSILYPQDDYFGMVWSQFFGEDKWLDFDELHASIDQIAARSTGGFTNSGESLFEAVVDTPVDFLGKTCGLSCARREHDLSRFLVKHCGLFDTRDEAFERLGSFQHTLRGRAFELVFGDRKSS